VGLELQLLLVVVLELVVTLLSLLLPEALVEEELLRVMPLQMVVLPQAHTRALMLVPIPEA
jgi:hypothetical protein